MCAFQKFSIFKNSKYKTHEVRMFFFFRNFFSIFFFSIKFYLLSKFNKFIIIIMYLSKIILPNIFNIMKYWYNTRILMSFHFLFLSIPLIFRAGSPHRMTQFTFVGNLHSSTKHTIQKDRQQKIELGWLNKKNFFIFFFLSSVLCILECHQQK